MIKSHVLGQHIIVFSLIFEDDNCGFRRHLLTTNNHYNQVMTCSLFQMNTKANPKNLDPNELLKIEEKNSRKLFTCNLISQ